MPWLLLGVAILVGLWAIGEDPSDIPGDAVNVILDFAGKGKRLTTSTTDENGVVQESPDDLVQQASQTLGRDVSRDAYALSRMVRSEEGSADTLTKVRLANVAMNQAAALGWSISDLMTFHRTASRSGHFGAQISGRFSTAQDSYESDLAAAEQALGAGDQTGGALNFADRAAFGIQAGSGSFESFNASLATEGKQPGTFPDSPQRLVFWWRGSLPAQAVPV